MNPGAGPSTCCTPGIPKGAALVPSAELPPGLPTLLLSQRTNSLQEKPMTQRRGLGQDEGRNVFRAPQRWEVAGSSLNTHPLGLQDGLYSVLGRSPGGTCGRAGRGCVVTGGTVCILPVTVDRVGDVPGVVLEALVTIRASLVGRWNVLVQSEIMAGV